ncbi:hypothetical protein FB382_003045 [Nocardioides ginsengisegetis]|uniref:Bacterial CdiA-CT RNAse A domain-containing protein n=1 Tax=Nocardioides ginsengisegetis TaxID=661491 RepID=A0A7W3J207_9ACTN|nr:RNase A-like domain-containing protein [Nocardioides ginsengisegetis]MBA8804754.1 hypothetical protein [Nocardioides ginsengisegetis]
MKLEIDGGGYESARTAFGEGNQLGALAHQRLVAGLTSTGGMAGDDSTSREFATAYDDSAREAVTALADLVDSFAGLGRLTHATLLNHARAEARSVVGGTPVYDGGVVPDVGPGAGYVAVLPSTPPTCLGATASAPYGHLVGWILDHIQGFVWPNADTDRLREAGATWRAAADGLLDLETACDQAVRGFWGERSPEVPLAVDATHELRRTVRTVADQYAALAAACDTYADQVDAKRHEVIDLAEWLLEQVVEGIAISAAIGVLTGGGGAIAGGSATVARVGAETPRFLEILTSLKALSASTAGTVRATRDALRSTRGVLVKFKEASVARSVAQGERGEFRVLWDRPGWLAKHENGPSHTLAKHVGQSEGQLADRFTGPKPPQFASTFSNQSSAERLIGEVLNRRIAQIEEWLASGHRRLRLDDVCEGSSGVSMDGSGAMHEVSGIRVILQRDASMPDGYRILTAFPQP